MATDNVPAPLAEGVELTPLYTERWLIFSASKGRETWWVWCPVRMTGGVDTLRIRWGRPMGELVDAEIEPDVSDGTGRPSQNQVWSYSTLPIASFDLPWLPPESVAG